MFYELRPIIFRAPKYSTGTPAQLRALLGELVGRDPRLPKPRRLHKHESTGPLFGFGRIKTVPPPKKDGLKPSAAALPVLAVKCYIVNCAPAPKASRAAREVDW